MTARSLALVLAASAGCGAPTAIPVFAPGLLPEHVAVVERGAEVLGYGVDWRSHGWGAIRLAIRQGPPGIAGEKLDARGCRRRVWSIEDPYVVAHELGHALGLDHVEDRRNVMWWIEGGSQVEPWQTAHVDDELRTMEVWCVD